MNLYDRYTDALEKVAKNVPTSPEKWARAKSAARAKFDVYPSAYANGWAAKKYKEMGGGWKKEASLQHDFPANEYGRAAAAQAIRGKSKDQKKRERRGIALAVGLPLAAVASGELYDRMKKKAEFDKEAFLAGLAGRTILGAGRLLKKPVSRLMLGKKSLSPQKRGAHLMKRVGQIGTAGAVVGGAADLTKRVANRKISTAKAPSVNTAAPPPSIQ